MIYVCDRKIGLNPIKVLPTNSATNHPVPCGILDFTTIQPPCLVAHWSASAFMQNNTTWSCCSRAAKLVGEKNFRNAPVKFFPLYSHPKNRFGHRVSGLLIWDQIKNQNGTHNVMRGEHRPPKAY